MLSINHSCNKEEKEFWLDRQEKASSLQAMFKRYLLCTGKWDSCNYAEVIGSKFHYLDLEWHDEYLKYDDDVFEVFIETIEGGLEKICFRFSDFLEWQRNR